MIKFYFVLSFIIVLFFILLLVKNFFKGKIKRNFCVVCLSVSLSWTGLLVLYFLGLFEDKVLLGILMGHTSLGIFYIFESSFSERFKVFRLPLLLTFVTIIYFLLSGFEPISFFILIGLWIVFGLVFLFLDTGEKQKSFVNKLIQCCRGW